MKKATLLFAFATFFIFLSCGSDDSAPVDTSDTEAPTAPQNLRATNITETSLELSWDVSTDNIEVAGYKLFQDGQEIESNLSSTNYSFTCLTENTSYTFTVSAFDAANNESSKSTAANTKTLEIIAEFKTNLSEMELFDSISTELIPAEGVQLYEINSTLFTDYAKKQRLIKLPGCEKMSYNNTDLLPNFPDKTIISKTFYYNTIASGNSTRVIETRVFIKKNGLWEVGNYIWNPTQTEATYTENEFTIPISFIDPSNETQNIDYKIPSKAQCFECHNNTDKTFPIGMKLRSMNFTPSYTSQNQLQHFIDQNLLEGVSPNEISILPDWTDSSFSIFEQGRAYMDVNCAHCHIPGGSADYVGMNLAYETPYADTRIYEKRSSIEIRFSTATPEYSMPLIGRTIIHPEALTMLQDYLAQIEAP